MRKENIILNISMKDFHDFVENLSDLNLIYLTLTACRYPPRRIAKAWFRRRTFHVPNLTE